LAEQSPCPRTVSRREGVIDVMLQEAENGTLEQAAAEIRATLTGIAD
jgi:hypothetical protein